MSRFYKCCLVFSTLFSLMAAGTPASSTGDQIDLSDANDLPIDILVHTFQFVKEGPAGIYILSNVRRGFRDALEMQDYIHKAFIEAFYPPVYKLLKEVWRQEHSIDKLIKLIEEDRKLPLSKRDREIGYLLSRGMQPKIQKLFKELFPNCLMHDPFYLDPKASLFCFGFLDLIKDEVRDRKHPKTPLINILGNNPFFKNPPFDLVDVHTFKKVKSPYYKMDLFENHNLSYNEALQVFEFYKRKDDELEIDRQQKDIIMFRTIEFHRSIPKVLYLCECIFNNNELLFRRDNAHIDMQFFCKVMGSVYSTDDAKKLLLSTITYNKEAPLGEEYFPWFVERMLYSGRPVDKITKDLEKLLKLGKIQPIFKHINTLDYYFGEHERFPLDDLRDLVNVYEQNGCSQEFQLIGMRSHHSPKEQIKLFKLFPELSNKLGIYTFFRNEKIKNRVYRHFIMLYMSFDKICQLPEILNKNKEYRKMKEEYKVFFVQSLPLWDDSYLNFISTINIAEKIKELYDSYISNDPNRTLVDFYQDASQMDDFEYYLRYHTKRPSNTLLIF